ncbi:MerR family transcriptional regulator [Pseudomonas sp. CAU 1711]|uniref:MerR family transcriptional regulator n=1 Tax=Pseudomonas sp. CAU 1711 TaxID=3140356 RepID=UPI0032600002
MTEPVRASADSRHAAELFPIREVARVTGVNPVTLRAWERRYGLIQPTRTDSGHRLYSAADIEAVRNILAWIERGVSVSKVGKLLARSPAPRSPLVADQAQAADQWQARARQALGALDARALEALYAEALATHPLPRVFQELCMPLWQELLLRRDEPGQVGEWLLLDAFLRSRALQHLQSRGEAAHVLLTALPGQCRELELLVAGLLLGGEDYAVRVLGPGLPQDELALVCARMRPQALVLFSNRPPAEDLAQRLKRLALSLDCPLALAGDAAELAEDELADSPIACLGNEGPLMRQRLRQFLVGHLDT